MRSSKRDIFQDKKQIRILLINPFGIGDVLFSTPLIKILKENFPHSSISYICNKRTYPILEKCPDLDRVFLFEKGDYKQLWRKDKITFLKEFISFMKMVKKEKFDLAIDMSMGYHYSLFSMFVGVPERVGFDYKGRGRFLTKKLKFGGFVDKPITEYYKDLLRLIGVKVWDFPTGIWWTDEDEDYINRFFKKISHKAGNLIIGLAPGGGISFGEERLHFKRWPSEKFAMLSDLLIKNMASKVILLWGPGEEGLIDEIIGIMEEDPVVAPPTNIRQLAALMSRCNCVVCNDSGPLHIAAASGTKTVSIFGPSDPIVYGPYPRGSDHIIVTKDIKCRPCYRNFKIPDCKSLDCLKTLDAMDIFLAIKNNISIKD